MVLGVVFRMIETLLYFMLHWYECYMYTPLQKVLCPVVMVIPRHINVNGRTYTVFTANIVTWFRTLLVIPIAYSLKYNYHWSGCCLIIFHDFLDHLDGIVAKAQKQKYGPVDDPLLGGFMDAFCDKIVNVMTIWTVLVVTDFSQMSWYMSVLYAAPCAGVIAYEFVLGVVRVQDYFKMFYLRKFKKIDPDSSKVSQSVAAVMAGKLKEKLESIGMAALCVSQASGAPLLCGSGILGVICLFLSIRLAHSSLAAKIQARLTHTRSQAHASEDEEEKKELSGKTPCPEELAGGSNGHGKIMVNDCSQTDVVCLRNESWDDTTNENFNLDPYEEEKSEPEKKTEENSLEKKSEPSQIHRCFSMPGTEMFNDANLDARAERVYTIGCFDLFHHGHVTLLKRMKTFGKKVIVGIHDSRSIYQLKNRVPIDSTITRMRNVKQFADEVFCVAGTDPTPFIDAIFDRENTESAIYIRGDDMPNFPARNLCEKLMTVKFLPYTAGVSSTKIRKNLFNSNHYDVRLDDTDIMFY